MATHPTTPTPTSNHNTPQHAPPSSPGGMASDALLAAANEIVMFVLGAAERHKGEDPDVVKSQLIGEVANKMKAAQTASSKGV